MKRARSALAAALSAAALASLSLNAATPAAASEDTAVEASEASEAADAADALIGPAAADRGFTTQAAAADAPNLTVMGRGFGHGRGLGQWGAYGYSVAFGSSAGLILDWFYGGTVPGQVDTSGDLRVKLSAYDNSWFILVSDTGNLVTPAAPGVHARTMLVIPVGDGTFGLFVGADCNANGPWGFVTIVAGPVQFWIDGQSPGSDNHTDWFGVCAPGGVRYYRGVAEATHTYAGPRLINQLPVEQYLKGVVPREMPASWGDGGDGRGLQALMAQTVAARSYALTENRAPGIYQICDSAACQVYGGAAFYAPESGKRWLEDNRTNAAIAWTVGIVRVWPDGSGIARTEYSASTGGHTSAGRYPAVADWGDEAQHVGNPNFRWQYTANLAGFQRAYPAVGRVTNVAVTARNGLGEWGGRATEVKVTGTGGTVTVDGETFGYLAGLGTDWFAVLSVQ